MATEMDSQRDGLERVAQTDNKSFIRKALPGVALGVLGLAVIGYQARGYFNDTKEGSLPKPVLTSESDFKYEKSTHKEVYDYLIKGSGSGFKLVTLEGRISSEPRYNDINNQGKSTSNITEEFGPKRLPIFDEMDENEPWVEMGQFIFGNQLKDHGHKLSTVYVHLEGMESEYTACTRFHIYDDKHLNALGNSTKVVDEHYLNQQPVKINGLARDAIKDQNFFMFTAESITYEVDGKEVTLKIADNFGKDVYDVSGIKGVKP